MKKPSGVQTDGSAQSLVDVAAIDQLAKIVSQYDLSEIEISLGDLQVRLARERAPSVRERSRDSLKRRRRRPMPRKAPPSFRLQSSRLQPIWPAP